MPSLILAFIATLCAGVFFGAAVYISLVQHPAALEAGGAVPGRFFAPMYHRAAPMQASLAILGAGTSLIAGLTGSGWSWILGGLLLLSAVPFTVFRMKSVNDQLKEAGRDPESAETLELLRRWGRLHAVRSVLSGLAFVLFVAHLAFG